MSQNPTINHRRRMFGHRDWQEGEPYIVGGIRRGTIYPDGGVVIDFAEFREKRFESTQIMLSDIAAATGARVVWHDGNRVRVRRIPITEAMRTTPLVHP